MGGDVSVHCSINAHSFFVFAFCPAFDALSNVVDVFDASDNVADALPRALDALNLTFDAYRRAYGDVNCINSPLNFDKSISCVFTTETVGVIISISSSPTNLLMQFNREQLK